MTIDSYCHILPRKFADSLFKKVPSGYYIEKRIRGVPALVDLDIRFRVMDQFPDYAQVISLPGVPGIESFARTNDTVELARIANDGLAGLVARYPDRFLAGVAAVPMNNTEAACREIERATGELGLRGIQICSHVDGRPLDDPELEPIFALMAEKDLPIWMHPARGNQFADYPTEDKSKYEIWHVFGWPYETAAAMTRIAFSGLFDRYPHLKIITHHMGGMVPYFEERIRGAYDQFGSRTAGEDYAALLKKLKKHPYDYFRMFYADTAIYGSIPAMECGLAFFGADHILFASDTPFDSEKGARYIRQTLRAMEGMTSSREDKQKISEGNARRLLKLDGLGSPLVTREPAFTAKRKVRKGVPSQGLSARTISSRALKKQRKARDP